MKQNKKVLDFDELDNLSTIKPEKHVVFLDNAPSAPEVIEQTPLIKTKNSILGDPILLLDLSKKYRKLLYILPSFIGKELSIFIKEVILSFGLLNSLSFSQNSDHFTFLIFTENLEEKSSILKFQIKISSKTSLFDSFITDINYKIFDLPSLETLMVVSRWHENYIVKSAKGTLYSLKGTELWELGNGIQGHYVEGDLLLMKNRFISINHKISEKYTCSFGAHFLSFLGGNLIADGQILKDFQTCDGFYTFFGKVLNSFGEFCGTSSMFFIEFNKILYQIDSTGLNEAPIPSQIDLIDAATNHFIRVNPTLSKINKFG